VQRRADPTKGGRSMQRHSSSHCQPLELPFRPVTAAPGIAQEIGSCSAACGAPLTVPGAAFCSRGERPDSWKE